MLKASPRNHLVRSPAYAKILFQYNELLKRDGKVNNKQFFQKFILPEIPGYKVQSWYMFLKRFKTEAGIIASPLETQPSGQHTALPIEAETKMELRSNHIATADMISRILNISADAARKIMEDPTILTEKERVELGLKVMKAQDSRIHAVGKIREDNREQERFDKAFDAAAYGG